MLNLSSLERNNWKIKYNFRRCSFESKVERNDNMKCKDIFSQMSPLFTFVQTRVLLALFGRNVNKATIKVKYTKL